jgi:uncharacterized membrane protein
LTPPSIRTCLALLAATALAACHSEVEDLPGGDSRQPYAGIGEGERLHFTGTEPFWGGDVSGGTLIYSTPEDQEGQAIEVSRFAGRGGLSFSGTLGDAPFVLAASELACSDGMSDRTYPFTITLQVGGEMRQGCGWTEARPFTGTETP